MDERWEVILLEEVRNWFVDLLESDPRTGERVAEALDHLVSEGPKLGRPLVDTIKGSHLANLKELRPGSSGRTEIRMLFVFDPQRQAVVLVAGDKSGDWVAWYRRNIPVAEVRYQQWLEGDHGREID